MGSVYIAISPSNKKYIGATSQNINERWKEHCQRAREGRNGAIYNAIRKYGQESFLLLTLFEDDDWSKICDCEIKMIAENNSLYPNGYNLTIGGEGVPGRVVTEESRKRMSDGQKKRFENKEQRELLKSYGKVANKNRSKKLAEIRLIKKAEREAYLISKEYKEFHSARTREGMSKVKDMVSECAKQRAANPEWRKKISESKMGQGLGSKRTEETKKKQAEARRIWWANRNSNQSN